MQDSLAEIESAGYRLVAVSADRQPEIEALRKRFGLTFPIISDADLAIAGSYGVRQKDMDVALPATFVVARDGHVRFVHVAANPVDRLAAPDLLAALRRSR